MSYKEKILICEDNDALSGMIKFKISRAGYSNIDIANDGKEAKELITNNDYSLIISDIHMPFLSGLELVVFIREELKSDVPIIIMSTAGVEDTILSSFSMGVNDFISKPLSPKELIVRVTKLLNQSNGVIKPV